MNELTAIIRDVGVGKRDMPRPGLWFTVYMNENSASLQCIMHDDPRFLEILKSVYDTKELEGAACFVEDDGRYIKFLRLWKR